MTAPFYIPLATYEGSNFSRTSWTLVIICLFGYNHPSGSGLTAVCISLMTRDVERFSHAYWPFICLFWGNSYSDPLPILKLGYLSLHYCVLFPGACLGLTTYSLCFRWSQFLWRRTLEFSLLVDVLFPWMKSLSYCSGCWVKSSR